MVHAGFLALHFIVMARSSERSVPRTGRLAFDDREWGGSVKACKKDVNSEEKERGNTCKDN